MHSRRPLPALALVLPHPPLPARSSLSHFTDARTPCTPRARSPSTPVLFPTQLVASPRTSIDSWGSSSGNGDDEVQWEWKTDQMSLLVRTLDVLPGHLLTPFNGPVPPSNLLDKLARSVTQAQGPLEWPHSVRATRAKLAEIARARDKGRSKENMTINEQDEDQSSSRQANTKRPLYRQSSMDFLPSKDKASGSLSRLSSRLQRADRMLTTYHPYPRPASRSPSPPTSTPRSDSSRQNTFRHIPVVIPSIPPKSLRSRTSSNSLGSRDPPQPLRRSASTISTHSNPTSGSTVLGSTAAGVLTPVNPARPIRRSDSFTHAPPTGPVLKRAPSFGATSIASGVLNTAPKEKQAQDPESDDEEKARDKKAKRPRTRSATASVPEKKKKRGEREKKAQVQKDPSVEGKASPSPAKTKTRSKPTRAGSTFGPELPEPQPHSVLPRGGSPSPPPGSPSKTLRRVKTTTFNLMSSSPAKKLSFGSLPEENERPEEGATPPALGSAFQLS